MLDTNICIYIMKNSPKQVWDKFNMLQPSDICMSTITYGELMYGVMKSERRERNLKTLQALIEIVIVKPLSVDVGRVYGNIRADLSQKGTIIGDNDLWIAAHALSEELILVTNNEREFIRVQDLNVENWVS